MNCGGSALFATPATAQALARTQAVVTLVGSYDGSGNFGDIVQLDAALELLDRLGSALLVLPVVERANLVGHRALAEHSLHPAAHALFFDPSGGADHDGLVPAPAPADLTLAACYLYGGGYLNSAWGERKLAMVRAADTLVSAGGLPDVCRLSSGLQVDAGWLAQLTPEDTELLRSFEPIGVRDPLSADALAPLGAERRVVETGDDAIGVLRRCPALSGGPSANGKVHVNLHFADHEWVTDRPRGLLRFYADLLDELARSSGAPIVAHPLVAYDDQRITEGSSVALLSETCSGLGVEIAQPRVLRPATLSNAIPELRRASLTVSCSYHVALTTLFLGIPTVVIRDNPYYEQKMAGLSEAFGLPPTFSVSTTSDPRATAQAVANTVLDPDRNQDLSRRLAGGTRKLLRRRAEVEIDIIGRLACGAMGAMTTRIEDLVERLRERSAEPANLLAQLSFLRSEHERILREGRTPGVGLDARQALEESRFALAAEREAMAVEESGRFLAEQQAREAEQRAREAEQRAREAEELLSMVLGSRSWAVTSPLRTAAALLRGEPGR